METKILTPLEEKEILLSLIDAEIIDNGAARCVFYCTSTAARIIGLTPNEEQDFVIKLACGVGGLAQTQAEIECFLENHHYAPLAYIIAYGRYIEVMEKVDASDYRDIAEEHYEDFSFNDYLMDNDYELDDEEYEDWEEAWQAIGALEDIFGHTSDNGQLGRNRAGKLVAYDYGFYSGIGCDQQTSDVVEYLYNDKSRLAYINGLINLLGAENDLLADFEDRFIESDGFVSCTKYRLITYSDELEYNEELDKYERVPRLYTRIYSNINYPHYCTENNEYPFFIRKVEFDSGVIVNEEVIEERGNDDELDQLLRLFNEKTLDEYAQ